MMNSWKKFRIFFVLTLALVLLVISLTRKSHSVLKRFDRQVSAAIFNELQSAQDDPNMIDIIRSDFLLPPAPSTSKLNFSKKIWSSPVASRVMKILKNKTHGFFVECGAFDGEWLSNSIEFEAHLNWSGLLIEADPNYQARLIKKNRKAWIAPVCLSPKPFPMTITMQRHKDWPAMSNIPNLFYGKTKPGDFNFRFDVQCFPLYSLLLALNRTVIDYLSLDVEGAEWSILQTIPFDKLTIKVISLEMSRDFEKSKKYLKSLGYILFAIIKKPFVIDAIFVYKGVLQTT